MTTRARSKEFLDHLNQLEVEYRNHRNKIIADYFFYMGAANKEERVEFRMGHRKPGWFRKLFDRRKKY